MSLTATFNLAVSGDYTRAKGYGLGTFSLAQHPIFTRLSLAFADGIGVGQADLLYVTNPVTPPSIALSSFTDIDLSGLTDDAIGDDIAIARVKAIAVYADPLNAHDLLLGGAATNPFLGPFEAATYKQRVRPGGLYLSVDVGTGFTVTPGTGDLFRIANSGAVSAVIYHALIVGVSA